MDEPLLQTQGVTKEFDGLFAVDDLSFSFDSDLLYAIIGPNGAGKTTLFNLLTGALKPTAGSITFAGEDVTDLSMEQVARRGLVRSYQISQLFEEMTVHENVRVAVQSDHSVFDCWSQIDDDEEINARTAEVLEQVGLSHRADELASSLSHGEQRTLEIAVALGTDPDLLLLDEPSSGMSPEETTDVIQLIGELASTQPIVFIEHKMSVVREVADRILVLHNGQKIAEGTPADVREDAEVQRVYLGGQKL